MPAFALLLGASVAVRAASLNMCSDEYLLLLGNPREIASVSRLSRDPADSRLWHIGRQYPGNSGTLESALAARPNLLITMGGAGRSSGLIAQKLGLRTLDLPFPVTIADVARNMDRVAVALGDPARSLPWKQKLNRLRTGQMPTRDAIFLGAGGTSVGDRSVEAEWMRLAGLKQRPLPGGRASLEMLATRPPAVILRSAYRRTEQSLGRAWLEHPLARPSASRIVTVDGRPWTCAGPLMIEEVSRLRGAI